MLTALLPLAALLSATTALRSPVPAPEPGAPALAAQAFADAERVVAVHELPGAVVFDLERAGERFQLALRLDDDGAVVAMAIDWVGPADPDGGVGPGAAAVLERIDRVEVAGDGASVILRSGTRSAQLAITGGA